MSSEMLLRPIGIYRSAQVHPYEAARQPREDRDNEGEILLESGQAFEQALTGLEGFDRVWILFRFHHNENWKPMVRPPRGATQKVGVFATRAPYRPNALGLSCVRLKSIEGLRVRVTGADLLDGTPIFDLKPYVPEADAFPDSRIGWLEGIHTRAYVVTWSAEAEEKRAWLESRGLENLQAFLEQQLEFEPFDEDRKRVHREGESYVLAYRTWRARFTEISEGQIQISDLFSGYSESDLATADDKWGDKNLHREFRTAKFPRRS